jgi:hypothetical protein
MLANLLCPVDVKVTFQNIKHYVPDIHQHSDELEHLHRPRIYKSHMPFQTKYPRALYIVRDGRDVYVSFYHYQRERLPQGTTFADYLCMEHWPCSWGEHVTSWLDAQLATDRFMLVYYRQLHEEPRKTLRSIADFVGLDVTHTQVERAIRRSSFDVMRNIEVISGHPRSHHFSGPFVRRGRIGRWRKYFGERERRIFKAREANTLIRLGYERGVDW